MSFEEQRVRDWIGDIVDNADKALDYVGELSFENWAADRMRVDAVERCLMRITEAAIPIGEVRMATIAPGLALHEVRGMGNLLRHEYDALDQKRVWRTVTEALPPLRRFCAEALLGN